MNSRTSAIVRVLSISFCSALLMAVAKLAFGKWSHSLAFTADGLHSIFDSLATLIGIISIVWSSKPPDEGHPYGHQKIETVSAVSLAFIILLTAYEVGTLALERILSKATPPAFSGWGILLIFIGMGINIVLARLEMRMAKALGSSFLVSDAAHNHGDFWIASAVLSTICAAYFQIPYVDGVASAGITLYLLYMGFRLMNFNIKPLTDHVVLDPKVVQEIVASTDGVLHCHAIRSRGNESAQFLDLNIHLPGHISLNRAHEITHAVEHRLREAFPALVDVVIHTEPDKHPPCSKDG